MGSSVEKALEILLLFDESKQLLGINEMSRLLGMPPSTVQRFVNILKKKGFLRQDPETRKYRLGTVLLKLAGFLKESLEIAKIAYPIMQRLSRETGETVHLNIIDGYERVCIESIESVQPLMARMPIGQRSPLYAGASSKCLLAFSDEEFVREYLEMVKLEKINMNTITDKEELLKELERTRKRGYAESFSERVTGLGALSAPVFDHRGKIAASLSLAIPEVRFRNEDTRRSYAEKLLAAARQISEILGYKG